MSDGHVEEISWDENNDRIVAVECGKRAHAEIIIEIK